MLVEGTLVSADISGFTALSERLAELGHEGAEQLTDLLNRCFAEMIDACERRGGDVIKFGGDALLVLFTGAEHARHAATAMAVMHRIVSRDWSTESAKRVSLGISQGAHSGRFGCSLVDMGHIELLVGGPAVSETVGREGEAGRGQILVSADMADLLPSDWLGRPAASGARPLVRRRIPTDDPGPPPPARAGVDGLDRYLAQALAESVSAGVPGEHRQVVIAFLDISETDTLYRRAGGLALHEACEQVAVNVRSILQDHPVHLMASDAYVNGTKLILTAGAPVSTDADEDHMLLALHELFSMDNPLPMKAGVNRGHVFVGDLGGPTRRAYTVMGDAVNLAARLMQHAGAGEVVASHDVIDRADTSFAVTELEPFLVKGKSHPIHAAVIGEPSAAEPDQPHIGHIGFVGRTSELADLTRLAGEASNGGGHLVEVTGEPGIGKSRLVREALQHHPELQLHRMRGGQYARNSPFFTIRGLLRRVLEIESEDPIEVGVELTDWVSSHAPDLTQWLPLIAIPLGAEVPSTPQVDLLAEQFRRDRLLRVTSDLLAQAMDGPTVLLAEDIHLFDTSSLDIIRQLGGRINARPWLIIATHRAEPGFVRPDSHQINLQALSEAELGSLAESAADLAGGDSADTRRLRSLAERAGGNPLFLLELVTAIREAGTDELPETVESLVTTRIDLLPAPDRMLLREAAVSGATFEADLLAEAFERSDLRQAGRWEALADFLVRDRPGTYRFRHGLYRDVAYAGLSYRRRREAHRSLGLTLEDRSRDHVVDVAPLLSDHFDRCRDRDRAWRYSVLAGDAARDTYANIEAINLYERALRNALSDDGSGRARVAEALGDVRHLNGEYEHAVEAFQRSRSEVGERAEDGVRLLRKIGNVRVREGELPNALRWYTRALKRLDGVSAEQQRLIEEAQVALGRAGALHRQGRNDKCAIWAERSARAAELADDRAARAGAYNMLEIAYRTLGRSQAAAEYSERALEMYAGSGDLVGEANVLNNRGIQAHFAGNWSEAIEDYDRSRLLRRQAGDVVGEALAANNIGEILSLQNRFDEAREHFESARVAWRTANYTVGVAYVMANLGVLEARAGDSERGLALLDEAEAAMTRLGVTGMLLDANARRVEAHLLAGRTHAALTLATELATRLRADHAGDDTLGTQLLPLLGLAYLRSGDVDTARSTLADAERQAAHNGDLYIEALSLAAAAELERAQGRDPGELHRRAGEIFDGLELVEWPGVVVQDRLTSMGDGGVKASSTGPRRGRDVSGRHRRS